MKIALFLMSYPPTSETFILEHIVLLREQGHEVDLFALMPPDQELYGHVLTVQQNHPAIRKYELDKSVSFFEPLVSSRLARIIRGAWLSLSYLPRKPWLLLRALNIFQLGKRAASMSVLFSAVPFFEQGTDYDLVHCHFGPMGNIAANLKDAGILNCPIITTFHGFDINVQPQITGPDTYRDLFRVSDVLTVVSMQTKQRLLKLGAPESKVSHLPMSVDVRKFEFERRAQDTAAVTILSVARLHPVKGHTYALDAIKLLSVAHEFKYLIVGIGPLEQELKQKVQDLGLGAYVEFLGYKNQTEVSALYADADIFLFSSIKDGSGAEEALPVALMEAQASGLPVVAHRTGGVPEVTIEDETAVLVPPKDPQAMANALSDLMADPVRRQEMGRRGRSYVSKTYDLSCFSQRLENLYARVLR